MLRHYGFYLNEETDKDMIDFLDKYVKTRRVGEVVRRALSEHVDHSKRPALALTYEPAVTPAPLTSLQITPGPVGTNDVVQKAKRAFFK